MYRPKIEMMDRDSLQELQLHRLKETVERVYANVPFYRNAFATKGITPDQIKTLDDVRRLPFTKKSDLRENYPFGLFAVSQKEVIRIHGSSGTKGKPTIVGYTERDLANWAEIVARAIVTAGGRPGDLFQNTYGYGLFTGGLGLHYGAERLGVTVIPVSGGNTPRQITILEDFNPRGIAGTPSYVLNIAEAMEAMGKDPRATSLEYGIFGAEPWSEEMRHTLEEKLGLKAIDIYGLSEVMGPGVAIECYEQQEGLHVAEDHFFIEVIDPNTLEPLPYGETGEFVFTSLTKEAFPIIRYRTGDIGFLYPEPCKCGRTHLRMSRIKGRIDDMVIIRGVNVFPSEIESVVLSHPNLAPHFQIQIDRKGTLDEIAVFVEVEEAFVLAVGEFDPSAEPYKRIRQEIMHELRNALLISTQVSLHPPGALPRSEGKANRVIDRRNLYQHS
ncbi:phenylacetate--CoA ligase family protein [Sulfoacidibacillus thermotolerans]|uniref:Phenylacetate-coenzyme A ligase n=1 Tax=Sulfoacidibacillus thermotolerans TaxID=1765684 RepID=A0A2U3D764_SULT2|nr:phenylacetate--CoA ligase [Sulfoacidibacillus thermotolerans]PWI57118.1 phenylacetate--CoA ligase [Sulfoacidibacillus thermotolerans]